jgi:hypothetical protein
MPLPFSHCRHCEAWPPWYASKERYKKAGRGYIGAASPGRCLKSLAPTWPACGPPRHAEPPDERGGRTGPSLRPAPSRIAAVTGSIRGKAGPLRVPAPDGKTGYKQAALRAAPDGPAFTPPLRKSPQGAYRGGYNGFTPDGSMYTLQAAAYRFWRASPLLSGIGTILPVSAKW